MMARPFKSGEEKAVIISMSIPFATKKYLDDNNLSPSKLFQELLLKYTSAPNEEKSISENDSKKVLREEIIGQLNGLKKLYIEKLKPEGNFLKKEHTFELAVNWLLKKYPTLTKANIYSYVERDSGYFELPEEPKEVERDESL